MSTDIPGAAPRIPNTASHRGVILGVGAAVLGVGLFTGVASTAVVVVLLSAAFAWGFPLLTNAPSPRGSTAVIAGVGVAGLVDEFAFPDHDMKATILALSIIAAFLHQMFRRDGRPRLVESVSTTVTGNVIVISGIGWIPAVAEPGGVTLGLVTAAALVVASMPMFFPLPLPLVTGLAVAGATALGAVLGAIVPQLETLAATTLSFAAGVLVVSVHVFLRRFPARLAPGAVAAGALVPLLAFGLPVAQFLSMM